MKSSDLAQLRLVNQRLSTSDRKIKSLVAYMGAMQAQDPLMCRWAVGIRIPGCTEQDVVNAISKGEIIRTHVLRPTWHLVAPEDLRWMLAITAPRIISNMKARLKELELTEAIFRKSNKLLEKELGKGASLSRDELQPFFERAKIPTDLNRLSHLLFRAELEGLICSGETPKGRHTYSLFDNRIPATKAIDKEEAYARLAERYFISHGPATLVDFTWWSGLSAGEAKKGLEAVRKDFSSYTVKDQTYWFRETKAVNKENEGVFLLPAYDEFIISYKDRSAVLDKEHMSRSISMNGIFKPVVVVKGRVAGLWKRSIVKDTVKIEIELFSKTSDQLKKRLQKSADEYGAFLGKKAVSSFV